MNKPTIGRIVHYVLSAADVAKIHRNRGHTFSSHEFNEVRSGQVCPAIVVAVSTHCDVIKNIIVRVNLKVLLDGTDGIWVTEVESNSMIGHPVPGTWSWPSKTEPETVRGEWREKPMKPHEQRVVTEKAQLDEKLEKLTAFTFTDTFSALPEGEQELLKRQREIMKQYSAILDERIRSFPRE